MNGLTKTELRDSRQSKVRGLLKQLGLWDGVKRINSSHAILSSYYPGISVELAADLRRYPESALIQKTLKVFVDSATMLFPLLGEKILVRDVMSFLLPVYHRFQTFYGTCSESKSLLAQVSKRLPRDTVADDIVKGIKELYQRLDDELTKFCRIDRNLYYLKVLYGWNKERNQWGVRFVIHREPIVKRDVVADGAGRRAYLCGAPFGNTGIAWVSWPRSFLGGGQGPRLPVFVQGHALDQLYRDPSKARLNIIENGDWIIHDYLWQSLADPKCVPLRRAGCYGIEYRLFNHKMGYLVAEQMGDIALIRTFLFLTMDGTPEGNRLWDKLRLKKRDKIATELDNIRTFLMTDLQFDKELVSILDECGCGHLFQVLKEQPRTLYQDGCAERIRKYLGLEMAEESKEHRHIL